MKRTATAQPGRRRRVLGGAFDWLEPRPRRPARLCAYIQREHARGRPLAEILEDPFVKRIARDSELKLLLERPHLVARLTEDCLSALRENAAQS